jgi:ribosomal protein S6
MVILPEALQEEQIEQGLDTFKNEIKTLGGVVNAATRMGKKNFARPLAKQRSGEFALVTFTLDGERVTRLHERIKHSDLLFRVQIIRVEEPVKKSA